MNFIQSKLTKEEWNTIEKPVSNNEKEILKLIIDGFHDPEIKENKTRTLYNLLKIPRSEMMEKYIYCKYLHSKLLKLSDKYKLNIENISIEKIQIKTSDSIKLNNTDELIKEKKNEIIEFIILDLYSKMYRFKSKNDYKWQSYYYTIKQILNYNIDINKYFLTQLELDHEINQRELIQLGYETLEINEYIYKYANKSLYKHQKDLFHVCNINNPKLILYVAPTGTGKTLSPLGLSEKSRIIFLCAARHIGLSFAKSAISCDKKIAFAFDCDTQDDVRLHYFSAKEYTKNRRSGGIGKVDNLIGDNVEIMICDLKSYLVAMEYMLNFNEREEIILYWDEPTISLDSINPDENTIELHDYIHQNWSNNLIPNVVLSSATLPQMHDLKSVIENFQNRFNNSHIENIISYDAVKSIPLINKEGFAMVPHTFFSNYDDMINVVDFYNKTKTLLRYMDLREIIRFILEYTKSNDDVLKQQFPSILDFSQENLKLFYLSLLKNISENEWKEINKCLNRTQRKRYRSTIYFTTEDAHTLTDGPTLFLAKNTEKIAQFCLQYSQIPITVLQNMNEAINYNFNINEKIRLLEKNLNDISSKDDKNIDAASKHVLDKIKELKHYLKPILMPSLFVPNTKEHLNKYFGREMNVKPFVCDLSEDIIERIILLSDIDITWKMLLLIGIGVMTNHKSKEYLEIMKQLAEDQKLYLIIASDDYIYGTNYQFCHGYIGKDMNQISQEKCIQAIGRIGRNQLQQDYSIRFRDNELLYKLVTEEKEKIEARNMCRLFSSK